MDPGAHLLLTFDAAALPHVGLAHEDMLGEPFFVKQALGCRPYTNIFDAIFGSEVTHDLEAFKAGCDVIVANRWSDELADVADKVYTRDLFKRD